MLLLLLIKKKEFWCAVQFTPFFLYHSYDQFIWYICVKRYDVGWTHTINNDINNGGNINQY